MAEIIKTIELDCAPGGRRPNHYIVGVLEDTNIPVKDTSDRCFGNWLWNYEEIPDDVWNKAQPIIKKRITKLLEEGKIRYGSW